MRGLIHTVAERIENYRAVRGDLRGLFASAGLDERSLGEYARCALRYVEELDASSFGWGLILGLLTNRERAPLERITDEDIDRLLS